MAGLTDSELEIAVAEAMGWRKQTLDDISLIAVWPPIMPQEVWVQPQGIFAWPVADWHPLTNKAQTMEVLEWLLEKRCALYRRFEGYSIEVWLEYKPGGYVGAEHTDLCRAICLAAAAVGKKEPTQGDYRRARGILPLKEGAEPSEVVMRRSRDE